MNIVHQIELTIPRGSELIGVRTEDEKVIVTYAVELDDEPGERPRKIGYRYAAAGISKREKKCSTTIKNTIRKNTTGGSR